MSANATNSENSATASWPISCAAKLMLAQKRVNGLEGLNRCLLWVRSGHLRRKKSCPLYPRKRTLPRIYRVTLLLRLLGDVDEIIDA